LQHPLRAEEAMADLRRRLDASIRLTAGPDLPVPATYQILVAGRPKPEELTASPYLQALIVPWAGIPESTRQLMYEFPRVAVHNLHHNALPVAEHALALLLAAAKFLVPMDQALRRHDWRPRYEPNPSLLLEGKTALVLGYGAIGRKVADLCQGLGMDVVAARRQMPTGDSPRDVASQRAVVDRRLAPIQDLHRLLPQADALLVCLPYTGETARLIGDRELDLLPAGAVLVNVGRGPIVDEAALYRALRDGRLYAAGLDVWYHYPQDTEARGHTPPSTYPFHELPNVVMSPHRAGGSTQTERLRAIHLARLLNAAARGEPMPNRVDLDAGY
jgi:phosphoglycerate dehydrogenase-like enzyme